MHTEGSSFIRHTKRRRQREERYGGRGKELDGKPRAAHCVASRFTSTRRWVGWQRMRSTSEAGCAQRKRPTHGWRGERLGGRGCCCCCWHGAALQVFLGHAGEVAVEQGLGRPAQEVVPPVRVRQQETEPAVAVERVVWKTKNKPSVNNRGKRSAVKPLSFALSHYFSFQTLNWDKKNSTLVLSCPINDILIECTASNFGRPREIEL